MCADTVKLLRGVIGTGVAQYQLSDRAGTWPLFYGLIRSR